MLDPNGITTRGRYCRSTGGDVPCLADVPATNLIEVRRLTDGPLPKLSEQVTCYLDNIGMVDGVVMHSAPGGFVLQIVTNPQRRSRIEARLAWLRSAELQNDQRKSVRIVPAHRAVQIKLQDAEAAEAIIADLFRTGAALLLNQRPDVGSTVTVGKRYATVVRHTPEGVGVAFRMPFDPLTFNEHVIL